MIALDIGDPGKISCLFWGLHLWLPSLLLLLLADQAHGEVGLGLAPPLQPVCCVRTHKVYFPNTARRLWTDGNRMVDDDVDYEAAFEASAIARLQAMAALALQAVCPEHGAAISALTKEAVKRRQARSNGPDLQCHAPATLWCRLRAGLRPGEPVRIRTCLLYTSPSPRDS